MLYEPPLMAGVADPQRHMAVLRRAMARGSSGDMGNVAGLGEGRFAKLPAAARQRILSNREHFQRFEFDRVEWYEPDPGAMAAVAGEVAVISGAKSPTFFGEAALWLAAKLGTTAIRLPTTHTPQTDDPALVAEAARAFMRDQPPGLPPTP